MLRSYGGPGHAELRDVPVPDPARGEIRVRVEAAGLNPVDYKIRNGMLRVVQGYRMPVVLGNELAGVVDACGEGVTRFAPGDRVFARVEKHRLGAFAQYACVGESVAARAPATVDAVHAAAVPLAALTALQGLREQLQAAPGKRLLIAGGAGGVGSFAIPLAKHLGAHVTTTASPRGDALVRKLGADAVVDYTREPLSAHARAFDGAFDLVGGSTLPALFGCVRRGGRVVSIAGLPEVRTALRDLDKPLLAPLFFVLSLGSTARAIVRGVDYRYLFMRPDGAMLAELASLVDAGTLPVTIDRVFAFEQIADAMAYLEAGHAKGKVVVRFSPA
ncbi:MAG TPA: NADP-dependent oxidoreductase [Xanthomonadales bacterium]|nr:NADP-dependent oxidoreductase [Xanthomonadales bacterium]